MQEINCGDLDTCTNMDSCSVGARARARSMQSTCPEIQGSGWLAHSGDAVGMPHRVLGTACPGGQSSARSWHGRYPG